MLYLVSAVYIHDEKNMAACSGRYLCTYVWKNTFCSIHSIGANLFLRSENLLLCQSKIWELAIDVEYSESWMANKALL